MLTWVKQKKLQQTQVYISEIYFYINFMPIFLCFNNYIKVFIQSL